MREGIGWRERHQAGRGAPLLQGFEYRRRLHLDKDRAKGRPRRRLEHAANSATWVVNALSCLFLGTVILAGGILGATGAAIGWAVGGISRRPHLARRGRRIGAGLGAGLAILAVGLPVMAVGYLALAGLSVAAYAGRGSAPKHRGTDAAEPHSPVPGSTPTTTGRPSAPERRLPSLAMPVVATGRGGPELER